MALKLDSTTSNPAPGKSNKVLLSNDFSKTEFDSAVVQPNLIKTRITDTRKVATVSLNDCLACRLAYLILFYSQLSQLRLIQNVVFIPVGV